MRFRTEAKNAYDLLREVRSLILANPQRYNQHDTLSFGKEGDTYWGDETKYPSCGTIGCRAGWVAALVAPRPNRLQNVMKYAQKVLGLTEEQADTFFDSYAAGRGSICTLEHARIGAKGITAFIRKNRNQLLAKRIR